MLLVNGHGIHFIGSFMKNFYSAFPKGIVFVALLWAGLSQVSAQVVFRETFDTNPIGATPQTSFEVTHQGVLFDMVFTSEGDGGDIAWDHVGGYENSPSINFNSASDNLVTREVVTITRRDGADFLFVALYIDNTAEPVTVQGFKDGNAVAGSLRTVPTGDKAVLDFGGVLVDEVKISADDFFLTIIDGVFLNYPPEITTSGGTTTFTESVSGGPVPVVIDNGLTVSDPDNTTLASATVAITGNFQIVEDVLGFTNDGVNMGNITGSYNAATGTLTLASAGATATLAEWEAALRAVTYSNTSEDPNVATRTISFVISDGTDDSAPATKSVAVVAVNNAPVVTVPASITVTEDEASPLSGISFADVDAGTGLVTATFSVPSGSLAATSGGGVTVGGTASALTLTGTIADINAFIAASGVTYTTASNATADVTLTVTINDNGNTGSGGAHEDTTTVTLEVTAVNDAPVNAVPAAQSVDQDGILVFSTGNGNVISVSDVDAGGGTIQVTLTATNGLLTLGSTTGLLFTVGDGAADGTMTFTGTIAAINAALNGLAFVPAAGYNGLASLQISSNDLGLTGAGGPQEANDTISITVNPISPIVNAVGASSPDGMYKVGDVVSLTVAFDQVVMVDESGGKPGLLLETGSTDREAVYVSGSGSNMLTFAYTVQAGDASADLDYASTAALALNGGTIQNAAGLDAVLTLPATGGANSIAGQHAIVIDGVAPEVTSVAVPADGYHVAGDALDFTVHFSENVTVDATGGRLHLEVTIGTAVVQAGYVSGSGSNALVFRYVVQAGEVDLDGIAVSGSLVLNGATARDAAGNDALPALNNVGTTTGVLVYAVRPSVTLSTPVSSPVNAPFTVSAVFSEAVTGFTAADINATNATVANLQTSDNITWTALVSPAADGVVSVQVPENVAVNIGSNLNTASNILDVSYDNTAPTVAIALSQTLLRDGDSMLVTLTFSEPVIGLANADITTPNGTLTPIGSADGGITWAAAFTPSAGVEVVDNVITVDNTGYQDLAGNAGAGTSDSDLYAIDTKGPTVITQHITVYLDNDGMVSILPQQIDNNSTDGFGIASLALSQTDFDCGQLGDNAVTLTATDVNGNVASADAIVTVVDSTVPVVRTRDIIVYLNASGAVSIAAADIDNGSSDACGIATVTLDRADFDRSHLGNNTVTLTVTDVNGNVARADATVTVVDNIAPVVTSTDVPANGYYREGDVLDFIVNFSKTVTVDENAGTPYMELTVGMATVRATYAGGSGSDALQFSYMVRAGDQDMDGIAVGGSIVPDGGTVRDVAGNDAAMELINVGNTGGVLVNTTHPGVVLTTTAVSPVDGPFTISVAFSEAVTGFTLDDLTAVNATLSGLQTTDYITYTVLATPSAGGTVRVSVPAGAAVNVAGNGNGTSNVLDIQYNQTVTGVTLAGRSFVYDGTAKSLAITGTLPVGTSVRYAGNGRTEVGSQTVTATISGSNYETLVLTAELTITPAVRSIDFPPLPEKAYGDADFVGGATASSGEAVSYTSSNTAVAEVVAGGRIRITGAGSATITATVPESGNYSNRPEVRRELTVRRAQQSISFSAPASVHRDAGSIALEVSASSGLPVSLAVDDGQVATVEGTALHIHRLGTVTITATQGGDANHEAAAPVALTVRVTDPSSDFPVRVHPAVSPNGDGINEFLIIEGIRDYPANRVKVFNRNGTVVWEASGYDNDRVAFRGIGTGQQRLPAGTYFYIVEIGRGGGTEYRRGYFVLKY